MAYVIVVKDDHTLTCTKRERIMQRSKLVNELWFLVPPNYNGLDVPSCTVSMEYVLPVSKKYKNKFLGFPEVYEDYLKYTIPFDTELTAEAGKLEVQLSFLYADLDENGKDIQRVRKTSTNYIEIVPIAAWSDIIPDESLTALDQRIIMQSAQIKALANLSEALYAEKADDLVYEDNVLQLTSNGNKIGKPVVIESCDNYLEDGIPVVDFTTAIVDDDDEVNNVVEF